MRPLNMVIVAITQYAIYYFLIYPAARISGNTPIAHDTYLIALIGITLGSLAIGNVYNDIRDVDIDLTNKYNKTYIREDRVSASEAKGFLAILCVALASVSLYCTFLLSAWTYFAMLLMAIIALFIYSKSLKSTPIIGNALVATLSAGVGGIILWMEYPVISSIPGAVKLLLNFVLISFFLTLYREIIKDIEDIDGDRKQGCHTLPVLYGVKTSNYIASSVLLLQASCILWLMHDTQIVYVYVGLAVVLLAMAVYTLFKTNKKKDYSNLSTASKILMVLILGIFIIHSKIIL